MKCPCEECISYAICKYKAHILCNDLYRFFIRDYEGFPSERFPNLVNVAIRDLENATYGVMG